MVEPLLQILQTLKEQRYANKFDNLDEIEELFECTNTPVHLRK
jgi:hypothetical protein